VRQLRHCAASGSPGRNLRAEGSSDRRGCLDAIARIGRSRSHAQPRVVGYDGTTTTLNLVDSARSALSRVVVQDTRELARTAVDQLLQLSQGSIDGNNVLWVEPYLYPRIATL
jgi:hypothetical protein